MNENINYSPDQILSRLEPHKKVVYRNFRKKAFNYFEQNPAEQQYLYIYIFFLTIQYNIFFFKNQKNSTKLKKSAETSVNRKKIL